MKKSIQIIFIVISTLIGLLFLDTIQALVFNNSPFFRIREDYNGGSLFYLDKGILVDTYQCTDGKKDTVFKGFSYSCSYTSDYVIVDTSLNEKDFNCAQELEKIYEDDNYIYYLGCIKSSCIEVRYNDGTKENIVEALNKGHIKINDLDKFNIGYIKEEK